MSGLKDGFLGGYVTRPTRVGRSHSYTAWESKTLAQIEQYILISQIKGVKLTDYTKQDWYYCMVENGAVFKYHLQDPFFYRLDLNDFTWVIDYSFVSVVYDNYIKFQEIPGFRDYFPHKPLEQAGL